MFRLVAASALALVVPTAALADAVVQSVRGEVRANNKPVEVKQRISSGSTVTTGADAQVVMRFDDGQSVVLNQNTEFRIIDFRYSEATPQNDRSTFELLKGAARFVTGAIGRRNQSAFHVRTAMATMGVRGTDFMVAIVNPLYISVLEGTATASNTAGTAVFGKGALGSVASAGNLATSISTAALPDAASSAFSSLGSAVIAPLAAATTPSFGTTPSGTSAGKQPGTSFGKQTGTSSGADASTTGTVVGGMTIGAWQVIGIGAAAAAILGGGGGGGGGGAPPPVVTTPAH